MKNYPYSMSERYKVSQNTRQIVSKLCSIDAEKRLTR